MGKSAVRMIDIAKRANVSLAAVGKVLQGTGGDRIRVSKQTAERVRKIARELNYRPNLAARQLAGRKSKTIGVLIDPLPTVANSVRLAEIGRQARRLGYHTLFLHENPQPDLVNECIDEFVSRGVDGIICVHHYYPEAHDKIANMIINSGIKNIVFIDKPEINYEYYVGVDFEKVSELAIDHLIERGKKRIAFVMSTLDWLSGPKLYTGYINTLKKHNIKPDKHIVWIGTERIGKDIEIHSLDHKLAEKIVDDVVIAGKADAIFADDLWAARIMNVLQERDFKIPDDIAIAGHGNTDVSDYIRPALTTVDLQYDIVAREAVDMLIKLIDRSDKPQDGQKIKSKLITTKLIIREST